MFITVLSFQNIVPSFETLLRDFFYVKNKCFDEQVDFALWKGAFLEPE